jgi:hypothetical protein
VAVRPIRAAPALRKTLREVGVRAHLEDGLQRIVTGTNLGAGVDGVIQAVPAGKLWVVQSLNIILTTDVNAASRLVVLQRDDATTLYGHTPGAATQPASNTIRYVWARGMGYPSAVGVSPDRLLIQSMDGEEQQFGGYQYRIDVVNIQVGDDLVVPVFLAHEFGLV